MIMLFGRAISVSQSRSVMSKRLGIVEKRGNGVVPDAIKPKGWVPPEDRIRDILIDCEAQH